jgi:hypothetical protein
MRGLRVTIRTNYRKPVLLTLLCLSGCATTKLEPIAVACPKPQVTPELLQPARHQAWDALMTLLPQALPNAPTTAPN